MPDFSILTHGLKVTTATPTSEGGQALDDNFSLLDTTKGNSEAHIAASTGVHGVAGSVVGTSDAQTLTSKNISGLTNTISHLSLSMISDAGSAAGYTAGGAAGNLPILDSNGLLPTANLPAIAYGTRFTAASQAAMLALTAQIGDVVKRTDLSNQLYMLSDTDSTQVSNWSQIGTAGTITSVNGQAGPTVNLTTSDISEGSNLYYLTSRVNTDAPNVTLGGSSLGLSLAGQVLVTNATTAATASTLAYRNGAADLFASTFRGRLSTTTSAPGGAINLIDFHDADSLANTFRVVDNGNVTAAGTITGATLSGSLSASNLTGTISAARLPNPTSTTLGGIQSAAAVNHQWIDSISTSGVPHLSQPAASDISGLAAVASSGSARDITTGTLSQNQFSLQFYAANAGGTAYTLTTTSAQVTFGTTTPAITIAVAGNYFLFAQISLATDGSDFSINVPYKLRRTNNTAADVANTSNTYVQDAYDGPGSFNATFNITIGPVPYVAGAGDTIAIFANASSNATGQTIKRPTNIMAVRVG